VCAALAASASWKSADPPVSGPTLPPTSRVFVVHDEVAVVVPPDHHAWSPVKEDPTTFNHKDPTAFRGVKHDATQQYPESPGLKSSEGSDVRCKRDSSLCQGGPRDETTQCQQGSSAAKSAHQGKLGAASGPGGKRTRPYPHVGVYGKCGYGEGLCSHALEGTSRGKGPRSQGCAGSDSSKGFRTGDKESSTTNSSDVQKTDCTGPTKGSTHGDDASAVGKPSHGSFEGRPLQSVHQGDHHAAVGELEERPLWGTSLCQVYRSSREVPTPIAEVRVLNVSAGVPRVKKDRQVVVRPLSSQSGDFLFGGGRVLDGGNPTTDRPHSDIGPLPCSEAVCRPHPESAGVPEADQNVKNPGTDIRSSPWSFPTLKFDDAIPRFMVSSRLNVSDMPKSLLEKTVDAVVLDDFFRILTLPFTEDEKKFLESSDHDPELILDQILESSGVRKKVKFRVDGVKCSSLPRRGPCSLPLAKITEGRIDYDKLLSLPVGPTSDLIEALSWIRTDRLRRCVMEHPLFEEMRAKASHHVSRHVAEDMIPLHEMGIFALHPWSPGSLEVPIFKVPKAGDKDSRLIGDARSINQLLPRLGEMGLPDLHDLIKGLLGKRYLFQLDARSYFYAFGLSESASEVFSVRWGRKRGKFQTSRWLVMPQGFSLAPRIAQHTSLHLSSNAVVGLPTAVLIPWVDNFLSGTDDMESMEKLLKNFYSICKTCNIELKPAEGEPSQTMDAIGIHFDVSAEDVREHFVELQADFREQMLKDQRLISPKMTGREYLQVFGGCMWANYAVARQPLCRWSHALATLREIAISIHKDGRQEAWDEPRAIPENSARDLLNMSNILRNSRRTWGEMEDRPSTVDVFTDASSWAWGYLKVHPTLQGAHRVHSIKDIFVAELLAACEAWFSTCEEVPNLHVDNTAAVGALVKGHSKTARGNLILSRLYEHLPKTSRARVTTVPTECQRADLVSRGIFAGGPACCHRHPCRSVAWVM